MANSALSVAMSNIVSENSRERPQPKVRAESQKANSPNVIAQATPM